MRNVDEIQKSDGWLSSTEYAFVLGQIYFHNGEKNPFDGEIRIAFDRGWLEEMHSTPLISDSTYELTNKQLIV
jgi:hypothetical protein